MRFCAFLCVFLYVGQHTSGDFAQTPSGNKLKVGACSYEPSGCGMWFVEVGRMLFNYTSSASLPKPCGLSEIRHVSKVSKVRHADRRWWRVGDVLCSSGMKDNMSSYAQADCVRRQYATHTHVTPHAHTPPHTQHSTISVSFYLICECFTITIESLKTFF